MMNGGRHTPCVPVDMGFDGDSIFPESGCPRLVGNVKKNATF